MYMNILLDTIMYWPRMLINILWRPLGANQYGRLSWRTGSIFICCKGLWDCLVLKPITTKHQSVFWLVSQSWRTPATFVGTCRWISLAAASDDSVLLTLYGSTTVKIWSPMHVSMYTGYGFFLVINGLWNLAHCKIWRTSKLSCHCGMMLERVWLKDDRSDNASGRPAYRLARRCRTDNNSLPPRFRRRQNMYFCTKAYVDCWYFTNLEYLDILLGVTKHRIGCIAEFCTTSGLFRHQSSPATTSSLFRSKMTCRLSIKTETIPSSSKQTNNASSRLPPYLSSAALL